jgi:hypothetical protein
MEVTTIGLDLAKNVFQVHGINDHGEIAFNRALRRAQVLAFLNGSSHVWSVLKRVERATTGRES